MSEISTNTLHSDNGVYNLSSKNTMLHDDFSARRRQINLESYQLVWLDPDFNRKNDTSIESLRNIVDYTKVFDNSDDCLEYIKQTQDSTTFVVCTKQLAQEFISQIHPLKHIFKIYVLSEPENHQKCFSNSSKV